MDQKTSTPQILTFSNSVFDDSLQALVASLPTLQEVCGDGFDLSSFDPDNPLSWPLEFFETCQPDREDTVVARVVSNNGNGTVILERVIAYRHNDRVSTQCIGKHDFLLDPRFLSLADLNLLKAGTLVWVWVEDLNPDNLGYFQGNRYISYYEFAPKAIWNLQRVRLAWAMADTTLKRLEEAFETGEVLTARVIDWKLNEKEGYPDGGVIVAIGLTTGFLHRSKMDYSRGLRSDLTFEEVREILKGMVGQEIHVKVGIINVEERELKLNERDAMDQIRKQRAEALWPTLKVGQVFEAMVNNIDGPLTFVRIEGCLDGIIHQSELQHGWVFDPADAVKPDDKFEVQVISVDGERRRVAFSHKALLPNPWTNRTRIEDLVGQLKTGVMTNQTQTGAIWVEIEPGIAGPLYPSDEPGLEFAKGQETSVKVLDVDFSQKRLVLSHSQALAEMYNVDLDTLVGSKPEEDNFPEIDLGTMVGSPDEIDLDLLVGANGCEFKPELNLDAVVG